MPRSQIRPQGIMHIPIPTRQICTTNPGSKTTIRAKIQRITKEAKVRHSLIDLPRAFPSGALRFGDNLTVVFRDHPDPTTRAESHHRVTGRAVLTFFPEEVVARGFVRVLPVLTCTFICDRNAFKRFRCVIQSFITAGIRACTTSNVHSWRQYVRPREGGACE
jgi:hypothetical protein